MDKITVVQPGARLHYAVPQIFARAGILDRLYTDLHAEHGFFRLIDQAWPLRARPPLVRRLLSRRLPPGLPADLVSDMPLGGLARFFADYLGLRTLRSEATTRRLLLNVEKHHWRKGSSLYTVLVNEDVELATRLKNRGVRIIHECMLTPEASDWLRAERERFPGLEPQDELASVEAGRERDRLKFAVADLVLVPSDFVREAVLRMGCAVEKIALVPYGLAVEKFDQPTDVEVGRVLFVGSVGLRKGSHYLAQASRKWKRQRADIRVRVVGPVSDNLRQDKLFLGPEYVGQIPRSSILDEYCKADVFVLPTLAEGMALVHLEALAAGIPVITTSNCGSVVRHGVDGLIIPVRDADAIVDAVNYIVSNRELREWMSKNARERAKSYSLEKYAVRLLEAVRRKT